MSPEPDLSADSPQEPEAPSTDPELDAAPELDTAPPAEDKEVVSFDDDGTVSVDDIPDPDEDQAEAAADEATNIPEFSSWEDATLESFPGEMQPWVMAVKQHFDVQAANTERERQGYEDAKGEFRELHQRLSAAGDEAGAIATQEVVQVTERLSEISRSYVDVSWKSFESRHPNLATLPAETLTHFDNSIESGEVNRFEGNLDEKFEEALRWSAYKTGVDLSAFETPKSAAPAPAPSIPKQDKSPQAAKQALVHEGGMATVVTRASPTDLSWDEILSNGEDLL